MTELAVAVDRRGAHQVADVFDGGGIGLGAGSERARDGLEEAHAPVGSREHEVALGVAAGLLQRDGRGEAGELGFVRHAVVEDVAGVPGFGDDAVRAALGREVLREGDEAYRAAGHVDRIDRMAEALRVERPDRAGDAPSLAAGAAEEDAEEAEARGMGGAHAVEPHDLLGRTHHADENAELGQKGRVHGDAVAVGAGAGGAAARAGQAAAGGGGEGLDDSGEAVGEETA